MEYIILIASKCDNTHSAEDNSSFRELFSMELCLLLLTKMTLKYYLKIVGINSMDSTIWVITLHRLKGFIIDYNLS